MGPPVDSGSHGQPCTRRSTGTFAPAAWRRRTPLLCPTPRVGRWVVDGWVAGCPGTAAEPPAGFLPWCLAPFLWERGLSLKDVTISFSFWISPSKRCGKRCGWFTVTSS